MYPNNKFNRICKLFCLAPISPNPNTQRVLTAYSWLVVTVLVLNSISSFTFNVYGDGYIVSSIATSAVFISVIVAHVITIVESLVKRKEQQEFFARLEELDNIFRFKLQHKIQLQPKRRKLIWKYSILSLTVLFFFVFNVCVFLRPDYEGFFWHAIVSVIISRMRLIQSCVFVDLVTYRFNSLNFLLKQISNCRIQLKNRVLDVDYSAIDNPNRVLVLKSIYAKLFDAMNCLNDTFGWSILTIVVYYCLDFTCNSYWQFLTWEKYIPSHNYYDSLATLFPITIMLTFCCYTCSQCKSESEITKQLVQKMLVTSSADHMNYLLNEFLLQIQHQPIIFHAKRFFCVDLKLLSSICATIIEFLVILIQFRYTENEL